MKMANNNRNHNDPYSTIVCVLCLSSIAGRPPQINGFYNDLALFKLSRRVELNEFVIPVCLPEEYENKPLNSLVGQTPSVIGWGTTFYGTGEVK